MDPKRDQEFSLEEIIREFGAAPETADPKPAEPEKTAAVSADTQVFQPVDQPEPPQAEFVPPQAKPAPEPFSAEWEPEYDEPMGEFIPPEPIQFPPSRLRTLRQKLVNGPERRYFALMELGLGKLKWGIFLHLLLASVSVALLVVFEMGLIPAQRLRPVIFGQQLLAMLSVLTGCYRLLDGIVALLKGRFTLELLLLVSVTVTIIDGFFCLGSGRMPGSALVCLQMLMAQWAAYQRRNTELCQMDTLRKAGDLSALVKLEDYLEGRPGYTCVPGEPEQFMEQYSCVCGPERGLRIFGALCLAASVLVAAVTGLSYGLPAGLQAMSAILLICMPATALVSMSRPAALVERRLHRMGAVLCGWSGVREAEKQAAFPVGFADLIPEGSIKMNGVRFCGSAEPGQVVACTVALLEADGKGLAEVFAQLPRGRSKGVPRLADFTAYDGGIGAVIDGRQVLFGTAQCLQDMGLALPAMGNVDFALYTAMDGEVSGVFVLSCQRSRSAATGLRALCGDRNVVPVLTDCDFLLTYPFIRRQLGIQAKRLYMPEREQRQMLSQRQAEADAPVVALITKPGLASKAYALNGARALRTAWKTGAAVHMLGGLIGLLAVSILALIGAQHLLKPANLLMYSTLWMVPGLLITQWARYL